MGSSSQKEFGMISKKNILIILSILLSVTLACMETSAPPTPMPLEATATMEVITTAVAGTVIAEGVEPPPAPGVTVLPTWTPTLLTDPSATPVITTPVITLTSTPLVVTSPSAPMASVSENTSCRSGPGKAYDYIGALVVGEQAEVTGKHSATGYWIIKNPDHAGDCWLWGQYATIQGSTSNLPERVTPPVPTPALPLPPKDFLVSYTCVPLVLPQYEMVINLSWIDKATNETGYNIYKDGIWVHSTKANVNSAAVTIQIDDGVTATFTIEAFNDAGVSAQKTDTAICQ